MVSTGTQAIIPKARGMYAKRVTNAEYEEMMRRRTVPEVAALLRRHPFFRASLSSLAADPHRGQIEELLNMDVFAKYQALVKYDFADDSFSSYYLEECELREILKALHLLSIGLPGGYMNQVPPYLAGRLRIDLFAMAGARTVPAFLETLRRTPFYKPLKESLEADPRMQDFALIEARLLRSFYADLFDKIEDSFSGREADGVSLLFLEEVEAYNLELILRVKTYFPHTYTQEQLHQLLLPYTNKVPKRQLERLLDAPSPEAFIATYRSLPSVKGSQVSANPEDFSIDVGRARYAGARRVLHLSYSPYAALAAFVTLTKLQKDNVVNVLEGVRYGMKPEQIAGLLWR